MWVVWEFSGESHPGGSVDDDAAIELGLGRHSRRVVRVGKVLLNKYKIGKVSFILFSLLKNGGSRLQKLSDAWQCLYSSVFMSFLQDPIDEYTQFGL